VTERRIADRAVVVAGCIIVKSRGRDRRVAGTCGVAVERAPTDSGVESFSIVVERFAPNRGVLEARGAIIERVIADGDVMVACYMMKESIFAQGGGFGWDNRRRAADQALAPETRT